MSDPSCTISGMVDDEKTLKLVSWNIAHRDLWADVESSGADIALLQECPIPPATPLGQRVIPREREKWATAGYERRTWRTAVVNVSERFPTEELNSRDLLTDDGVAVGVSRHGTVTVARVADSDGTTLVRVASVYSAWDRSIDSPDLIYADASAHRVLSDLSILIPHTKPEPLIVAGDWNLLHGYGEDGHPYWAARYQSVFDRAEAMGLVMVGPQAPHGRQASPWPQELPKDSLNVPTFHTAAQQAVGATRQLDFVFATKSLASRVHVRAANDVEGWGPSDHCRVFIDVDLEQ